MMYKEKIINIQTGEETWRDYTAAEIVQMKKAEKEAEAKAIAEAAREKARESAFAKLAALGLTEDEIAAL